MRFVLGSFLGLVLAAVGHAQPAPRYGIDPDPKAYPQGTPKEALASVLKTVGAKRIDYLLAYLADPQFVDQRVKDSGGRFDELVKETKAKLLDDPGAAKQLRRFLDEGEWKIDGNNASVRLKDVSDRWVYLRKVGDRWFLENRRKPEPVKEKEP